MGARGSALAERRRKVPTSAIGAPIHEAEIPRASFSNNYTDYCCNNMLNADKSKHHADVIDMYAASHGSSLDKLDKAPPESTAFSLGGVPRFQVDKDQVRRQSSPWQGGQVSLVLVLRQDVQLLLVYTVCVRLNLL